MIPTNVGIAISSGQRSPEAWAEMVVRKIITVADTAHPEIRNQAHEFRTRIEQVISHYMKMILEEERAYAIAAIESASPEAAAILRARG